MTNPTFSTKFNFFLLNNSTLLFETDDVNSLEKSMFYYIDEIKKKKNYVELMSELIKFIPSTILNIDINSIDRNTLFIYLTSWIDSYNLNPIYNKNNKRCSYLSFYNCKFDQDFISELMLSYPDIFSRALLHSNNCSLLSILIEKERLFSLKDLIVLATKSDMSYIDTLIYYFKENSSNIKYSLFNLLIQNSKLVNFDNFKNDKVLLKKLVDCYISSNVDGFFVNNYNKEDLSSQQLKKIAFFNKFKPFLNSIIVESFNDIMDLSRSFYYLKKNHFIKLLNITYDLLNDEQWNIIKSHPFFVNEFNDYYLLPLKYSKDYVQDIMSKNPWNFVLFSSELQDYYVETYSLDFNKYKGLYAYHPDKESVSNDIWISLLLDAEISLKFLPEWLFVGERALTDNDWINILINSKRNNYVRYLNNKRDKFFTKEFLEKLVSALQNEDPSHYLFNKLIIRNYLKKNAKNKAEENLIQLAKNGNTNLFAKKLITFCKKNPNEEFIIEVLKYFKLS